MKIKQRIIQFIEFKGLSKDAFCKPIGLTNSLLSDSSMNKYLGSDKIFSILKGYPELSAEWLLRGEGEMIRKVEPEAPSCATQEILTLIKSLNDKIDNMSSQIEELKKTDARPDEDAVCAAAG
ncbi:MAG: hypothetical protein IJY00_05120 [Bacteroidaceae bacterium]|nr:hypothetical protein [Bacteroidaceae bacterium]